LSRLPAKGRYGLLCRRRSSGFCSKNHAELQTERYDSRSEFIVLKMPEIQKPNCGSHARLLGVLATAVAHHLPRKELTHNEIWTG
jgi:hypothetical protein